MPARRKAWWSISTTSNASFANAWSTCSITGRSTTFDDNPTVERILLWAWRRLDGTLAGLDELVLWETARLVRAFCGTTSPARRNAHVIALAEIFYTVQGEGTWTGMPAVFVRLAGCNLSCDFCDTDYSMKALCRFDADRCDVRALSADSPGRSF